jgi:hypothetical protein
LAIAKHTSEMQASHLRVDVTIEPFVASCTPWRNISAMSVFFKVVVSASEMIEELLAFVQMFELFTSMKERATLANDEALSIIVDDSIALWTKMAIAEADHTRKIEENVRRMQTECEQLLDQLKSQMVQLEPGLKRLRKDEISATLGGGMGGSGKGGLGGSMGGMGGSSGGMGASSGNMGGGAGHWSGRGDGASASGEMCGIGLILKCSPSGKLSLICHVMCVAADILQDKVSSSVYQI